MTGPLIFIDPELWHRSRAGARAGRGFRYQDAAGALLATEIWRGVGPWSVIVPEGLDDVTLHAASSECRLQLKARHDSRATFSISEVAKYLAKSATSCDAKALQEGRLFCALMLEREVEGLSATGWVVSLGGSGQDLSALIVELERQPLPLPLEARDFLDRCHLLVLPEPIDCAVTHLVEALAIVEGAARLAAHDLRHAAGICADENYNAKAGMERERNADFRQSTCISRH